MKNAYIHVYQKLDDEILGYKVNPINMRQIQFPNILLNTYTVELVSLI
jgi:hypothetical protein